MLASLPTVAAASAPGPLGGARTVGSVGAVAVTRRTDNPTRRPAPTPSRQLQPPEAPVAVGRGGAEEPPSHQAHAIASSPSQPVS